MSKVAVGPYIKRTRKFRFRILFNSGRPGDWKTYPEANEKMLKEWIDRAALGPAATDHGYRGEIMQVTE